MARSLNQQSNMPQMSAAFAGWFSPITIVKITQTIINGFNTDTRKTIKFNGIIQPLKPTDLKQYPDGQRDWSWLQIHCQGRSIDLATNDKILYNGQQYKIMRINDYSLNNYIELHAVQDFVPS